MVEPGWNTLVPFGAIISFVLWFFVWRVHRANLGGSAAVVASMACVAWLTATALPTGAGWVTPENAFPAAPGILLSMFVAAALLAASRVGHAISQTTSLGVLTVFQGFRLPLELVLHQWTEEGVAPPQMTWSGSNPDIIAGGVALVAAPLAATHRWAAWTAWLVGAALLANVVRVAVTSIAGTPLTAFEEPLFLPFMATTMPIASVCVIGAATVHMITLRKLLAPAEPTN